ncbi:FliM/FliN family flagellar motor switch protein [Rhodobacteraceae bacterium B1Z28]|uniref:FliM/FliN family flagellar motor switch protein n=1 Tax=Ruegeria haliotis TaxID=2747601 RepID=A0ABX2PU39_9RHOB|nr:FliM/FliN family flagellar motor switch protein [Ruegeria haliotis]NVO57215.1 FliM/FliN family flagellar motor switch protein [Ruegeria haliotis]
MGQTVSAALARKLSVGKDDLRDRPRSVLRALRLGFARAAGDRLNLPLAVIGVKQSNRSQDDLVQMIGEDWLLLLFNGTEGVAAACLDPGFVSAIVQTQTIGEVTADPSEARAFTDTDAAMVAPLIEEALIRAVALVEAAADQVCLSGYEFASRAADLRSMSLGLVDDTYRIFDLTVDLAGGLRQGQISILLPDLPVMSAPVEDAQVDTGPCLEQSSGVLRAELNAVLCKMTLPLAGLSGLEVGGLLPLASARLDRTEILTIDRTSAAVGRLGQCGGLRAIRLNEQAPLPALTEPGVPEFVENRSVRARQEPLDPSALAADVLDVTPDGGSHHGLNPLDSDLSFANSDQMVAEITQLAGLTSPEDGPDRID